MATIYKGKAFGFYNFGAFNKFISSYPSAESVIIRSIDEGEFQENISVFHIGEVTLLYDSHRRRSSEKLWPDFEVEVTIFGEAAELEKRILEEAGK